MGLLETIGKGLKVVTGVQAYQDRKAAKALREEAEEIIYEIEQENEKLKTKVNERLESFGKLRCNALHVTVGPFIHQLSLMKQKVKAKEYEFVTSVDLPEEYVAHLASLDMGASNALKTAGVSGSMAAVALSGVPSMVTGAVSTLATASTGTAISSLSGAAATNATLAWLGGGSIATGGGGIALGSTVLAGVTYTTAGVFALAAAGIVAGSFYSKKLTEATEYHSQVCIWAANMRGGFEVMEGIVKRCDELSHVTKQLQKRTVEQIELLKPLVPCFDTNDEYFLTTFKNVGMLVKSLSEICQVPILDQDGNASEASKVMITEVQHLLNTEL